MQSGGVLGIKKRRIGNLSKGEYFVGKITHRMEAPFVPLALELPISTQKPVEIHFRSGGLYPPKLHYNAHSSNADKL